MRILVTGSRDWTDWRTLNLALIETAKSDRDVTLVHGCARGTDSLAAAAARKLGWQVEDHPADWNAPCRASCGPRDHRRPGRGGVEYCPAAGDYRNQAMVDQGADVCLAFFVHGSLNKGTTDCATRAKKAGILVVRIVQE